MPSRARAAQLSSSKPHHTVGQLVRGALTASSLFHFSSRAKHQPRSSSPDLHRGVIFRHSRWKAGAKKSLDQAAGKQSLARQEGAGGGIQGALPACSHRGSFLCHTSLASQKQPPKGKTLARLPVHARMVEGPGAELGAGQERAEVAVGGEELARASHETPAQGGCPLQRSHQSLAFVPVHCWWEQWEDGAAEGGRSAWRGAAMLQHMGKVLQGGD